MSSSRNRSRGMAIVAGLRTPFCKVGGALQGASAADLATHAFRELLDRTNIRREEIDEVILGCAGPDAREANIARVAALRAGLPETTPAVTIMRNCASGMEAVAAAKQKLAAGEGEVFLVGGTESMSNFPLMMGPQLVRFFTRLNKARTLPKRLRTLLSFRPSAMKPRIAIMEGLTDPTTGLMMGNTAELVAQRFGIDRMAMDAYALQSHQRASAAQRSDRFARELVPMIAPPTFRSAVEADDGIRMEQTIEALQKLRPVFDRHEGDVTVGNSCQITDGATALLVTSLSKAKKLGLEPLAIIRSTATAALSPSTMGLGPVHATPLALERAGITLDDIDVAELNEAFAAQVLGCLKAFADDDYCRKAVGLEAALGQLDPARVNINGGAIAIGHPIAATGARLLLTLAHELRQQNARYGLATLCIGGGQGQAIILEAA
ncbi:MAG: acetyl-CoA acetyltransferase family protein [Planctomycetota bacterium]|jgi:acetyl-CoA acetyltransferase family protein